MDNKNRGGRQPRSGRDGGRGREQRKRGGRGGRGGRGQAQRGADRNEEKHVTPVEVLKSLKKKKQIDIKTVDDVDLVVKQYSQKGLKHEDFLTVFEMQLLQNECSLLACFRVLKDCHFESITGHPLLLKKLNILFRLFHESIVNHLKKEERKVLERSVDIQQQLFDSPFVSKALTRLLEGFGGSELSRRIGDCVLALLLQGYVPATKTEYEDFAGLIAVLGAQQRVFCAKRLAENASRGNNEEYVDDDITSASIVPTAKEIRRWREQPGAILDQLSVLQKQSDIDTKSCLVYQFRALRADMCLTLQADIEALWSDQNDVKAPSGSRKQYLNQLRRRTIKNCSIVKLGGGRTDATLLHFHIPAISSPSLSVLERLLGVGALVGMIQRTEIVFGTVRKRIQQDKEHDGYTCSIEPENISVIHWAVSCKSKKSHADEHSAPVLLIAICPGFYGYQHTLTMLKSLRAAPHRFPFEQELVHFGDPCDAIEPILRVLDIAQDDGIRQNLQLNESQEAALFSSLEHRVSLIHGPPGTGKTHVSVSLASLLLEHTDLTVMYVAQTNHALDQCLEHLSNRGFHEDIARIGGRSQSERLHDRTLFELDKEEGKNKERTEKKDVAVARKRLNELRELVAEQLDNLEAIKTALDFSKESLTLLNENVLTAEERRAFEMKQVEENAEDGMTVVTGKVRKPNYLYKAWHKGNDLPLQFRADLENHPLWLQNERERRDTIEKWSSRLSQVSPEELEKLNGVLLLEQQAAATLSLLYKTTKQRVLRNSRLIGATATGAAKNADILINADVSVLIVEEAAEMLSPHLFASIQPNIKHLVLIGDHQQLRPRVNSVELQADHRGGAFDVDISLFERVVHRRSAERSPHIVTLMEQRRMRPEISKYVRALMYPNLQDWIDPNGYNPVPGLYKPVMFINHSMPETKLPENPTSSANQHEASLVAAIVKHLISSHGHAADSIVVLVPYVAQFHLLRPLIDQVVLHERDRDDYQDEFGVDLENNAELNGKTAQVRVCTIDNFQGEESDIIICSLVKSNDECKIGFLKMPQRVNVMLSRAKRGMVVVGNFATLCGDPRPLKQEEKNRYRKQNRRIVGSAETYKHWNKVREIAKDNKEYFASGFRVECARHRAAVFAKTGGELLRASEESPCGKRCGRPFVKCGHQCSAPCTTDVMHTNTHLCMHPVPGRACEADVEHKYEVLCSQLDSPCPDCLFEKRKRDIEEQLELDTTKKVAEMRRKRGANEQKQKQEVQRMKEEAERKVQTSREELEAHQQQLKDVKKEAEKRARKLEEAAFREARQAAETLQRYLDSHPDVKEADARRELETERECFVCCEDKPVKEFYVCSSKQCECNAVDEILTCKSCVEECIAAQVTEGEIIDKFVLTGEDGEEHTAVLADVRHLLSDILFEQAQKAIERHLEHATRVEVKKEIETENRRNALLAREEKEIEKHLKFLEFDILLNKCPRCKKPWYREEGCLAMKCKACRCAFCALCMEDCGVDAHTHVPKCRFNPKDGKNRVFMEDQNEYRKNNDVYKLELFRAYKNKLDVGDAELRQKIVTKLDEKWQEYLDT